jgi:DNA-binding transcriptional MocR family regulator
VPGCCFFPDRSGPNTLRLSYSLATEEAIQEGISRLGEMFGNHLAQVG